MIRFNPTVHLGIYKEQTSYTKGAGNTKTRTLVGSFYCEWKNAFGERATASQALGVNQSATVRTHFNPTIYQALCENNCIIGKNGEDPAWILWGGVDNVNEENQFMEFRVRRYEAK